MDNFIEEAEKVINIQMLKIASKDMKEYWPLLTEITTDVYRAYIGEGFTEIQAFEIAKEYTLRLLIRE